MFLATIHKYSHMETHKHRVARLLMSDSVTVLMRQKSEWLGVCGKYYQRSVPTVQRAYVRKIPCGEVWSFGGSYNRAALV